MAVQWQCNGSAMAVQWQCDGSAMAVQWQCDGIVVIRSRHFNGFVRGDDKFEGDAAPTTQQDEGVRIGSLAYAPQRHRDYVERGTG